MNFDITTRTTRRQAIKAGGLSVTLAALVAACGDGREGDDAPGRVGNAPSVTSPPEYEVDDAVLLRTASSLEYTAIAVYEEALGIDGAIPADLVPIVNRLIEDHQSVADRMVDLTEAAGGVAWTEPNPWFMGRLVSPTVELIQSEIVGVVTTDEDGSTKVQVIGELFDIQENITTSLGEITATSSVDTDDLSDGDEITFTRLPDAASEDVLAFAQALESLAAASHQELASAASTIDARVAHLEAASLEARHAAKLAIAIQGSDGYISPALVGEDVVPSPRFQIRHFAVESVFGETAQIEIKAGPADLNAVRESVVMQTPAANSFVYNELDPSS